MINADKFADVFNVVEHLIQVIASANHSGIGVNAQHSAAVGNGLDRFIVFAAAEIKQRFRRRMARHDRLFRVFRSFNRTAAAGVRHVHNDSGFVQTGDKFPSEITDSGIGRLRTAVSDKVAAVVGQVHQTDTHSAPVIDPVQFGLAVFHLSHDRRSVDAPHDGNFALIVDAFDIVAVSRLGDGVAEVAQQLHIARHAADILFS